jgi:hypothetical protein
MENVRYVCPTQRPVERGSLSSDRRDERRPPSSLTNADRPLIDRDLCVWAFDLYGRDLGELTLFERKSRAQKADPHRARQPAALLGNFDNAIRLLLAADRMKPNGIVSKTHDAPYRSRQSPTGSSAQPGARRIKNTGTI